MKAAVCSVFCVLLFVSFTSHASDTFTFCDSCTSAQMSAIAIENAGELHRSRHYVHNVGTGELRYFLIRNDVEHQRREVTELQASDAVKSALRNFILQVERYNTSVKQLSPVNPNNTFQIQQQNVNQCKGGNYVNVYDVISSSETRKNLYDQHADVFPLAHNVVNGLAALSNLTVNVGNFNLGINLLLPIEYHLPGGGQIKVYANPIAETFEVVPGTARECGGQYIPLSRDDLNGQTLRFNSRVAADQFNIWMMGFNSSTPSLPICNQNFFIMACGRNSRGEISCPATCKY
ncbi:MAG: hypothetical protein M1473_01010 [Firmicutes bacterium]|nr:hypothetical protein [Bacillota bacterium]